jgi:phosphohistidine phosphatase
MRRHVLLVRHAKSAWDDPILNDHDRPLSARGKKAVVDLGDYLGGVQRRPDVVLCSSSRRTVDTLEGIRVALPRRARVEVAEELYLASANTMLSLLHDLDDDVRCAMLIGHNPGTQDLALLLVGSGAPELREQLAAKLPTAAAVTLSFTGSWADLGEGDARIDGMWVPRPPRL